MPQNWVYTPFDSGRVRDLVSQMRISPMLARVLDARGYNTSAAAATFLESRLTELLEPQLLPGVSQAMSLLMEAIESQRCIVIYGDYDVDGVSATSILWHCLKRAGAKVKYHIPHRLEDGYGLNNEAIRQIHAEDPQSLVITVDCGIASVGEAALAAEIGLQLLITDHHHIGDDLPAAAALVHPRLPGTQYPFGELCGAGVAFKVAWALCQQLGDGKKAPAHLRDFLMTATGLAALGTIADVVPLTGENRILVRYGLRMLKERPPLGLKSLFKLTQLDQRESLSAEDIAFQIAPRLNAAGRLGQARLAVELLTTDSEERAEKLAVYLDEQNKVRQTVERRMFKQARELVDAHPEWLDQPVLVLDHNDWHAGVIGIVASRVVEQYGKPAVMLAVSPAEGLATGSARSYAGFDWHAGLSACAPHLLRFGGHQMAAGCKLSSSKIADFRNALCEHAAGTWIPKDSAESISIDTEVQLAELTVPAVRSLDELGPFGRENPRPVLVAHRVELAEPPKKMGQGERHLSIMVRQAGRNMRGIAFGKADWADQMQAVAGPLSICFAPSINQFRGQNNVEMQLLDWHPADSSKGGGATVASSSDGSEFSSGGIEISGDVAEERLAR